MILRFASASVCALQDAMTSFTLHGIVVLHVLCVTSWLKLLQDDRQRQLVACPSEITRGDGGVLAVSRLARAAPSLPKAMFSTMQEPSVPVDRLFELPPKTQPFSFFVCSVNRTRAQDSSICSSITFITTT